MLRLLAVPYRGCSLDLGISGHELRMIIAEADENDDGVIDYREFVPVAIELIQSFKARQEVRRPTSLFRRR